MNTETESAPAVSTWPPPAEVWLPKALSDCVARPAPRNRIDELCAIATAGYTGAQKAESGIAATRCAAVATAAIAAARNEIIRMMRGVDIAAETAREARDIAAKF